MLLSAPFALRLSDPQGFLALLQSHLGPANDAGGPDPDLLGVPNLLGEFGVAALDRAGLFGRALDALVQPGDDVPGRGLALSGPDHDGAALGNTGEADLDLFLCDSVLGLGLVAGSFLAGQFFLQARQALFCLL